MTSHVRCARYKEGCRWIDKMLNAQDTAINNVMYAVKTPAATQTEACVYDHDATTTTPCPYDCGARLTRLDYDAHLRRVCPRRSVVCQSCDQQFSGDTFETHEGNCPMETVWCENKCGARLQRRHLASHSQNDCHKRLVACSHCHKQFVYETLQDHHNQCSRFLLACPNRCDGGKIAREDLTAHLSQFCPAAVIPCQFREIGCKHVCRRYAMESHQSSASRSHLSLVCSLAVDQQRQIDEMSRRLAAVDTAHAAADGSFLWRITGFASSKNSPGRQVHSTTFYTSPYGYRLRATLFPGGSGSGEGTHLSVYIRVVAGDYDALLDWPFRLPVSVILYDQDGHRGRHVVESFVPSPACRQFQRPAATRDSSGGNPAPGDSAGGGVGFGYPRFLSLEQLRCGCYVRDDTVFVKFKVEQTPPVVEHC